MLTQVAILPIPAEMRTPVIIPQVQAVMLHLEADVKTLPEIHPEMMLALPEIHPEMM